MNPSPTDLESELNRFVVLHHQFPAGHARVEHWDLMLESEGKLKTWSLAELPRAGLVTSAIELSDHRIEYLEYEGPVSHNRGSVTRVLAGTYCWQVNQGEWERSAVLMFEGTKWELKIFRDGRESRASFNESSN